MITQGDLDAIVARATKFPERGDVSLDEQRRFYNDALGEFEAEQENTRTPVTSDQAQKLYASLDIVAGYERHGALEHSRVGERSAILPKNWSDIYAAVNEEFGTNLHEMERGDHQVYVWLERGENGQGVLKSYGTAHVDLHNRLDSHYFEVVGDFDQLSDVVKTFERDGNVSNEMSNLSRFAAGVFEWSFADRPGGSTETALDQDMYALHFKVPDEQAKVVYR